MPTNESTRSFIRRHTMPTQVWYKAYPGLTALTWKQHAHPPWIGVTGLSDEEAREWVALL